MAGAPSPSPLVSPLASALPGAVLVIGATGMLGRPVAEYLRDERVEVRVLARSPERARAMLGDGFDYRRGDVTEQATLAAALEGCAGVHVSLRATTRAAAIAVEAEGTRAVAEAAAKAGVARLTYLSGAGVDEADPAYFSVRVKQTAEAAIRESGVSYTILRATHFMESLDLFIRGKAAVIPGRQPHRWHYIAARDYAAQVLAAHRSEAAANRAFTLLGPEALTMREALERYVSALHPGAKVRQMPLPLMRLIARVTGNGELAMLAGLFEAFRNNPEGGGGADADAVLGPARTDLATWLEDRRCSERTEAL